jgi:hypothetical protein
LGEASDMLDHQLDKERRERDGRTLADVFGGNMSR